MKTCPSCAENIPNNADVCPYCNIAVHDAQGRAPASGGGGGKSSSGIGLALIIIGGGLAALLVCGGILAALMLPAVQQAREAARRSQCKNNLKQIGLALHNYADTYGMFPPAFIADESGKPMHSWRVLILPYIDQMGLYQQYSFSEPWDGPNNSRLLSMMPPVFSCPSHGGPGATTTAYAAAFGEHCIFRGAQGVKMMDVTDGLSNTLLVGEAMEAGIPWMKPEDVDVSKFATIGNPGGFKSDHVGGAHFLLGDGAVRFISQGINPQTMQSLFTRDGAELVGGDF